MVGKRIETGQICTSRYPIEKVRNFSYPYLVNMRISRQNVNRFGQYFREQVYLSSLIIMELQRHFMKNVKA